MNRLVEKLPVICVILLSVVVFITAWQFPTFQPYTVDEAHVPGPGWVVAARSEPFIRCGDQYAAGMSSCNGYSGLIDGAYLWVASKVTGRVPILDDPEFVDPLLQWLLILKRGFFVLVFLLMSFYLLRRLIKNDVIVSLTLIGLMTSKFMQYRAVEISLNSELGVVIVFLFSVFLLQTYSIETRLLGCRHGMLFGVLASIKVPGALFSILPVNSIRSLIGIVLGAFIVMAGLLFSSHELATVTSTLWAYKNGPDRPLLEKLVLNTSLTVGAFWPLIPLFLAGVYATAKRVLEFGPRKLLFWKWAFFLFITWVAMSSRNSQGRYFIGFTGIYLIFAAIGFSMAWQWCKNRFTEYQKFFEPAALVFLVCLTLFISGLRSGTAVESLKTVGRYFSSGETHLSENEELIIGVLDSGARVYIDHRIRANLISIPLSRFGDQVSNIDLFNEFDKPENGSVLFTLCYDPRGLTDWGVKNLGAIEASIQAQCGDEDRFDHQLLNKFQNSRFFPISPTAPGRRRVRLVRHDVVGQIKLQRVKMKTGQKQILYPYSFSVSGPFFQEWGGSNVTNRSREISKDVFSLRKPILFDQGEHKLNAVIRSSYRADASRLTMKLDGEERGECALNTRPNLLAELAVPGFLHDLYTWWRRRYYPVECVYSVSIKNAGLRSIEFVVDSDESRGSVRFYHFELE